MYKNEEYEIDNWIECEKCHSWRKVTHEADSLLKKVSLGDQFFCKKIGK
jgi:hypothetical protein